MKFDTKKEEQSAMQILREGANSPFWLLIVKALEESKQFIQKEMDSEDMKELNAEQYKLMNELYKAKKTYLDTLMNTPKNIASWLEQPESERQEFDPYDK